MGRAWWREQRFSLTYDQGLEMAQHARPAEMAGIDVYFADPHCPWHRAINENTNGLLRQYFPKSTDLSGFTQAELDAVAWQLNTRPRKSLAWKRPAELFMPESFGSLNIIINSLHFGLETARNNQDTPLFVPTR